MPMKMMLQNIRERSEALLADGQRQNDTGNKAAGQARPQGES